MRLTGKNNDYCFFTCYENEDSKIREDCNLYSVCYERQMYEKLKHYEDLEEVGRLVVLPEGIRQQDIWEPFMALNCPSKFGLMEKGHCVAGCGDCWEAALKGENNGD